MNNLLLFFTTIFCLYLGGNGQISINTPCIKVTQPAVNLTAITGTWRELYKARVDEEADMQCIVVNIQEASASANYTLDISKDGIIKKEHKILAGKVNKTAETNNAEFIINFPSIKKGENAPFHIVDTDNVNYLLLSSCEDDVDTGRSNTYFWILSRKAHLVPSLIAQIVLKMNTTHIEWSQLEAISHTADDCDDGAATNTIAIFTLVLSAMITKFL